MYNVCIPMPIKAGYVAYTLCIQIHILYTCWILKEGLYIRKHTCHTVQGTILKYPPPSPSLQMPPYYNTHSVPLKLFLMSSMT